MQPFVSTCASKSVSVRRWWHVPIRLEWIFAIFLLLANAPLFWGGSTEAFAFIPSRILAGEWWRVLTHAFVHVSWYHLLLDGSAFLMLCAEMRHWKLTSRISAIAVCAAASLIIALVSPIVWTHGFSGLSGVAHGLMVISSLEMIRCGERWLGWCALTAVLCKGAIEAITGNVMLSFLHFNLMGAPIALCHAGGILGGLIFYLRARRFLQ